jgi:hypothetical protein
MDSIALTAFSPGGIASPAGRQAVRLQLRETRTYFTSPVRKVEYRAESYP